MDVANSNSAELARSVNEPQTFKDGVKFDGGVQRRTEMLTAATTLTLQQSGTLFGLDNADGFTVTLPDPATVDGIMYEFVVTTAPTTAYIITTADADNIIHGQITTGEDAAGSVVTAAAADVINFVANKAIIGDKVKVQSIDGKWMIEGFCAVQDGMTTVQTA